LRELEAEFKSVFGVLYTESVRGRIIVLADFVDTALIELIEGFFKKQCKEIQKGKESLDQIVGSAFGRHLDLAFLLGLIPSKTFDDLKKLQKIRNHVAHSFFLTKFEDPEIKNNFQSMNVHKELLKIKLDDQKKNGQNYESNDFLFTDTLAFLGMDVLWQFPERQARLLARAMHDQLFKKDNK